MTINKTGRITIKVEVKRKWWLKIAMAACATYLLITGNKPEDNRRVVEWLSTHGHRLKVVNDD